CSGSASSGPISAEWTLLSTPGLSSVTSVSDPTSLTPFFIMDEPGTYEVKLYVQLTDDNTKFDSDIVLIVANPPEISSFSPTNGTAGTEVTITGKNYSSFPEGNIVKFNGLSAEITDASDTTLTVIAPQGVTTGPITVGIEETAEQVVSNQDFIVAGTGFTTVVTGVEALWGVDFGNQSVGVAVGDLGIILYTSDGGYTWNTAVSNTTQSLRAVSFGTSSTAYAVGGLGGILKTTDGGSTWNTITTGTVSGMNAVSFLDENTGFVAGYEPNAILYTEDGGVTWEDRSPQTYNTFDDVSFITYDAGTVTSKYDVFNTTDGGITWSNAQGIYPDGDYHISFISPETGWIAGDFVSALGEGHIAHTTDGGNTYTQQPNGVNALFMDVHFIDENNGMVVGFSNSILQTTDGGANWQLLDPGVENHLFTAVHLLQSNNAIIVGFDMDTNGIILLRN
ncbi:MAG: IPT/TIG domain-containing protein, partial [Bacteroidales bacterium]|nr:IPT/TIG domain-containing protein [Bacteroidales bacterium]